MVLVVILIFIYTLQSLLCKFYADAYPGKPENSSLVYSLFCGLFVSLATAAIAGFSVDMSALTLLLGVLNGIVLFGYNTALIGAAACGPYSLMMIIMLFGGVIVPMISSTLFFNGAITPWQGLAVALMLVSMVLMNLPDKRTAKAADAQTSLKSDAQTSPKPETAKNRKLKFIAWCTLLFVCNGLYGALLEAQSKLTAAASAASYDAAGSRSAMLIATFLTSSVCGAVLLIAKNGKTLPAVLHQTRRSAMWLFLTCAIATLAVNLLMLCFPLVNTTVLYTMDNGGVLLLSTLCSYIFFHEKPTLWHTVGIITSAVSLVWLGYLGNA